MTTPNNYSRLPAETRLDIIEQTMRRDREEVVKCVKVGSVLLVNENIEKQNERIDKLASKLAVIEKNIGKVDGNVEFTIATHINNLHDDLSGVKQRLNRVDTIQKRVDQLAESVKLTLEQTSALLEANNGICDELTNITGRINRGAELRDIDKDASQLIIDNFDGRLKKLGDSVNVRFKDNGEYIGTMNSRLGELIDGVIPAKKKFDDFKDDIISNFGALERRFIGRVESLERHIHTKTPTANHGKSEDDFENSGVNYYPTMFCPNCRTTIECTVSLSVDKKDGKE
jgi:CII-binding regulator of phage lambda lysogenization HflD